MPTSGWPIWTSASGAPTRQSGWSASTRPRLTEFLQIVYTLFIPAVLFVACVLWRKGRIGEFQYYAFLIALGFLASYIGYLLVPARGPRFLLKHLQHVPLQGLWLFQGHAIARWTAWNRPITTVFRAAIRNSPSWRGGAAGWFRSGCFRVYFAYTPCIIFATVYLRYHYTVDVLAGAVLAVGLILSRPCAVPETCHKGGIAIGRH